MRSRIHSAQVRVKAACLKFSRVPRLPLTSPINEVFPEASARSPSKRDGSSDIWDDRGQCLSKSRLGVEEPIDI